MYLMCKVRTVSDIITIKNTSKVSNDSNKLKKETGHAFKINQTDSLNLHNFDFTKKILYHPEKISAYKNRERPISYNYGC